MDPAEQKFLNEVWAAAITRRLKPVVTNGAPNTLGSCSASVLKLDADSFVITFKQGEQNLLLLWVMAMFCEIDQNLWWKDATVLFPEETPKDFVANNLNFIVPTSDNFNYMKCMKTGMTMDLVDRSDKALLFESTDRVVAFLNRWIQFIGFYLNDLNRATDFLNLSLDLQNKALKGRIESVNDPNKKTDVLNLTLDLQKKALKKRIDPAEQKDYVSAIEFYDDSLPLALIESGKPLPNLNTTILQSYLQTSQNARKMIVSRYPRHQALLQRDRALLKKLKNIR
jgi:hypothetical protein